MGQQKEKGRTQGWEVNPRPPQQIIAGQPAELLRKTGANCGYLRSCVAANDHAEGTLILTHLLINQNARTIQIVSLNNDTLQKNDAQIQGDQKMAIDLVLLQLATECDSPATLALKCMVQEKELVWKIKNGVDH